MKSKKSMVAVIVSSVVLLGIVVMWLLRDFDAQGYVNAILDQTFQGNVENAVTFVDDKTEEELQKQYEEGIQSFVESNITNGIEMEEELEAQYVALCKEIFKNMTYSVKEAEKINRKEYHVPVEYRSSDVFQRFTEAVAAESARLLEKVDKGEYKGTMEEINQQMQQEFLNNCYELFKTAYEEMEYAESETIIFVVKRNEDRLFTVDDAQMQEFVVKIIGLDEKQD